MFHFNKLILGVLKFIYCRKQITVHVPFSHFEPYLDPLGSIDGKHSICVIGLC